MSTIALFAIKQNVYAQVPDPINFKLEISENNILQDESEYTKSLTRHNITWTFSEPVQYGQFTNGDYWVIDKGSGISIVQIIPESTENSGRIMNGSMINPVSSSNGYDSSFGGFSSLLNVARPNGNSLSSSNPAVIKAPASLVSSKTSTDPNSRPLLIDASVLTILSSPPPTGSFRPPYAGTDKSTYWNSANIRWDILPKLPKSAITNLPDLTLLSDRIERVWLDQGGGAWTGRYFHPSNNMPDYGRDMANITGDVSLALLLDFGLNDIEKLMFNYLQLGIDWYGVTNSSPNIFSTTTQGGLWMGGGGHGHGRKWPILFAGLMFNDQNIIKYADASKYKIFQEEQQYFYVSQTDVDRLRYTADGRLREPYTVQMIGSPEWGEQHTNQPARDGSNWNVVYREIVSASIAGHALAAIIMNAQGSWNWQAFFDYQDRWAIHQKESSKSIAYSAFANDMWATFRYQKVQ